MAPDCTAFSAPQKGKQMPTSAGALEVAEHGFERAIRPDEQRRREHQPASVACAIAVARTWMA
jgi:hypothetical protein